MNTATEVKVESDSEQTSIDRRRGMSLVGPSPRKEKRSAFKITVSKEIFSDTRQSENSLSGEPTDAEKKDPSRRLVTLSAGVVILGAIVLGYLVGRKRD